MISSVEETIKQILLETQFVTFKHLSAETKIPLKSSQAQLKEFFISNKDKLKNLKACCFEYGFSGTGTKKLKFRLSSEFNEKSSVLYCLYLNDFEGSSDAGYGQWDYLMKGNSCFTEKYFDYCLYELQEISIDKDCIKRKHSKQTNEIPREQNSTAPIERLTMKLPKPSEQKSVNVPRESETKISEPTDSITKVKESSLGEHKDTKKQKKRQKKIFTKDDIVTVDEQAEQGKEQKKEVNHKKRIRVEDEDEDKSELEELEDPSPRKKNDSVARTLYPVVTGKKKIKVEKKKVHVDEKGKIITETVFEEEEVEVPVSLSKGGEPKTSNSSDINKSNTNNNPGMKKKNIKQGSLMDFFKKKDKQ